MFLLERLPKEEKRETIQKTTNDKTKMLENEIVKNISYQLNKPWLLEFQQDRDVQSFVPNNINFIRTTDESDEGV